jgi:uncharacterized protein YicC (UPF0701 family)
MTSLAGRAYAVKDSVEHLRQQQEGAGFSLRHDISESLSSMEQYMGKADAALNSRNPEATKKYMDLASEKSRSWRSSLADRFSARGNVKWTLQR